MLVSAAQQSESAVCTHTSPLVWSSFPLGHHGALRAIQWVLISYLFYKQHQQCMCPSPSPSSSHPPFPFGVHMFILYACASTSPLKIRSSLPLFQSPHTCINTVVFLFLTKFTLYDFLFYFPQGICYRQEWIPLFLCSSLPLEFRHQESRKFACLAHLGFVYSQDSVKHTTGPRQVSLTSICE